jgi:hypothetical protein
VAEALREYEMLEGHEIDKIINGEKLKRQPVKRDNEVEESAEKQEDSDPADTEQAGSKLDALR